MERVNIYGFPHKGIRNGLSQLLVLAGKTDYTSVNAVNQLNELSLEIIKILTLHSHSEDSVVLPAIEAKVPESVQENMEEHEALEKEVEDIAKQIKIIQSNPNQTAGVVYFNTINGFISRYLLHMEMEEKEINAIIWKAFSDEEIMAWHGQVMSTLTPDQIMLWFKYIVPALNPMEQSILLGEFKSSAPNEFYQCVMNMLKGHLSKKDYDSLAA
ncbi:hemerythrin domain-containing protein [Gaetbulibacter sp. M235]|uniref:hemerythrin domain-containing protein n=1 Tax=Gaetbulibacter sp. M235 TaxID=3126510 RepID=UPI00374FAA2C